MQIAENIEDISQRSCRPAILQDPLESEASRMRALRRKARRVSTYARWSATVLNALAVQVESGYRGVWQH